MSDNIALVIEKVRKLLALAANNTNENECMAARAAADRLIQEHRIAQADLEAQGSAPSEPFVRKVVSEGGRRLGWQEVILGELCHHFGGAFYFMSYRSGGVAHTRGRRGSKGVQTYTVLARQSDLAVIEYMYAYLCGEVDRLCRWHCGGEGIRTAVAWRLGCASGIASQFRDLRAAMRASANTESRSCAIVLLDKREGEAKDELARQVKLVQGAAVGACSDSSAYHNGHAEGRKVQIKQGLAEGPPLPKLA